jgi:hypothetical protein
MLDVYAAKANAPASNSTTTLNTEGANRDKKLKPRFSPTKNLSLNLDISLYYSGLVEV